MKFLIVTIQNEKYWAVLSCGVVYYTTQVRFWMNFHIKPFQFSH